MIGLKEQFPDIFKSKLKQRLTNLQNTAFITELTQKDYLYYPNSVTSNLQSSKRHSKPSRTWTYTCLQESIMFWGFPSLLSQNERWLTHTLWLLQKAQQHIRGDHYPLPNISDLLSFLNGAKYFSKDLLKAYYQGPMLTARQSNNPNPFRNVHCNSNYFGPFKVGPHSKGRFTILSVLHR